MRVILSSAARADLKDIENYLKQRSEMGFSHVTTDIKTTINDIADGLNRGRKISSVAIFERITSAYKYRIPYRIKQDTVYILRVYHPSRRALDYETL